ncbi:MAG TPA: sulfotransferase [Rhodanobacter sp.]|nr:sulfotransferase [Rhodanobacter sp.]
MQFDAARLLAEIEALGPDRWIDHPQKFPGNFALPLIAVNGDPTSDAIAGPMRPTPALAECPYLMQVLHRLGAVWGRTRLMKLSGHAEVTRHTDLSYYWRERVRVHVPIRTKPNVRFFCGDADVNMAAGECWIFNTWLSHRVVNGDDDERIHLVADSVGSEPFWQLVRNGRAPGHGNFQGWRAEHVAPAPDATPDLMYESVNVPQVMTPWEIREHLMFLLSDVRPHPQIPVVQALISRFAFIWQALWAQYGSDRSGWPHYRRALDQFRQQMTQAAAPLQLACGTQFMSGLGAGILDVALADRNQDFGARETRPPPRGAEASSQYDPEFDRPVFIVSSPRSGSTLLFETLAQARGLYTIGRESHALIEGMAALNAGQLGYASNRLPASAATPAVVQELRQRMWAELRDRDGVPPTDAPVRVLEKTPKNALRVPFLAEVFPQARFVYLYRDPRQTLSSMIEAWQSGRFRTYAGLPGWEGLPWSMLLVPGWRELNGRSLQQIVAAQWEITTQTLLDDLSALPAGRCEVVHYDAFLANPADEVARLCKSLDLTWDRPLGEALPLSRYTVSEPAADKWRRHADLIDEVLPALQATRDRAERFVGR